MIQNFRTRAMPLLAALLLSAGSVQPVLAHGGAQPKHGGIVQLASDLSFELVARADGVTIHVEDHGKPASTAGMSGRLTVLNGAEKSEADLTPAGDRLEAKGIRLATGAKVVAALQTAAKKAITVRFTVR